jgi:hypothetical protein
MTRICSVCCSHSYTLCSLLIIHQQIWRNVVVRSCIFNMNNIAGVTNGVGTVYCSGPSSIVCGARAGQSLVFCVVFCQSLFKFCQFTITALLPIWMSVCYIEINTWYFPYQPQTQSSADMSRGMIAGLLWKRSCISLFIIYFRQIILTREIKKLKN